MGGGVSVIVRVQARMIDIAEKSVGFPNSSSMLPFPRMAGF